MFNTIYESSPGQERVVLTSFGLVPSAGSQGEANAVSESSLDRILLLPEDSSSIPGTGAADLDSSGSAEFDGTLCLACSSYSPHFGAGLELSGERSHALGCCAGNFEFVTTSKQGEYPWPLEFPL